MLREVQPLPKKIGVLLDVTEKLARVPNFLPQDGSVHSLIAPDSAFFLVDDVGIIGAMGIKRGHSAHVHVTFWDGRLRGREVLCREVAQLIIHVADLSGVFTAIPSERRTVVAFARRVGFDIVGVRKGVTVLWLKGE